MPNVKVLYDGWPLIYQPDGAAALHLGTLLSLTPQDVDTALALPVAESPQGFLEGVELAHAETRNLSRWQQRVLPGLAEQRSAQIIHSSLPAASLFGRVLTLIGPSGYGALEPAQAGWRARFGQALGRGGLARARILYPADLEAPQLPGDMRALPPTVNPAFRGAPARAPDELELPETYLLYHGPSHPGTLLQLLESWTWAAASIGEYYPLVMLGLSEEAKQFVEERLPEFHIEDFVHLLPSVHPAHVAPIYQHCSALLHPAPPSLWGSPLRHALACGKPVVSFEGAQAEKLVGPAGYLVDAGDLRAFGAAAITVVVEEKVREDLKAAALKRAAAWGEAEFRSELGEIYLEML